MQAQLDVVWIELLIEMQQVRHATHASSSRFQVLHATCESSGAWKSCQRAAQQQFLVTYMHVTPSLQGVMAWRHWSPLSPDGDPRTARPDTVPKFSPWSDRQAKTFIRYNQAQ